MKKSLFLLIFCISLIGCVQKEEVKGESDFNGVITEVDPKGKRILVDDTESGLIWITLHDNGNIKDYKENQEIVVWTQGEIDDADPPQTKALNIEFVAPNQ